MKDLYDILGVSKTATQSEIERAYKEKAQKIHPDKGGEHESFIELARAYDTLKDSQKRRLYDVNGNSDETQNIYVAAVDTIKVLAVQLINTIGSELITRNGDLIDIINKHLNKEIRNAKASKIQQKEKMLMFGQLKSQVYSKNDRNLIHEVLDDQIKLCLNVIAEADRRDAICRACLEILKDYSYGLIEITGDK